MDSSAFRRQVLASAGAVALTGLAGCSIGILDRRSSPEVTKVTVGSKIFPENRLLGAMTYEQLLTVEGVQPVHAMGYGRSKPTWQALRDAEIDTYWDYTGTIWHIYEPRRTERIDDPDRLYQRTKADVGREHDLTVFDKAGFENPFVFVTRSGWADQVGVDSISDLVAHVNAGNTDVGVAVGYDFFNRSDGWPGLVDWYGVDNPPLQKWEVNVEIVDLVLAYDFLLEGDVDVAMGYATDAHIMEYEFEVLEDDQNFFPIYNPVPLFRPESANRIPDLPELINPLTEVVDSVDEMRSLNSRFVFGDEDPRDVARDVLEREGVLE